ncbi:choice-of-anchor D domain-containing protein [bacterium]|nr:choice-of-anchor D domain-containing protein [bacterium]
MKKLILWMGVLLLLTMPAAAQDHFTPVGATGLPYAVVFQQATLDGEGLVAGDEIGVFDGELCVGAGVVGESWPLSVTTWQADASQGLEGFTSGNEMSYFVYDASAEMEAAGAATYLTGDGTFGLGFGTNISLLSATSGSTDLPDINVSPTTIDFGQVEVGDVLSWMVTISNVGTAELSLTDGTSDNEAFTLDEPSDLTLDPEQEETVLVHFSPNSEGMFTGTITISSNDPDEPTVEVAVSGEGVAAPAHFVSVPPTGLPYAVVVQAASLDEEALGAGDEIAVFDGALCVGSLVLDGDWPASITTWQADASQELDGFTPGNTITFRIWSAFGEQELSAVPEYAVGDGTFGFGFGTNVSMLVATTGGGDDPDIHLPLTTHGFGEVSVGITDVWGMEIQNSGEQDLTVSGVSSNHPAFTIDTAFPIVIEPGTNEWVSVQFTPTTTGLVEASLAVTSNDPDEGELLVTVSGVGVAGDAHFTPVEPTGLPYAVVVQAASLDEEALGVGDEIAVFDGELCVGSLVLDGDWPASITAWQADASQELDGFTPGNMISFRIWSAAGQQELPAVPEYAVGDGTFGFGFGTNVSQLTSVSGGLGPDIALTDTEHDFGEVTVGEEVPWNTTVQNVGDEELVISQITTDNASFTTSGPVNIPAQSSATVTITFSPTESGELSGTITLTSNDPDEAEVTIAVNGIGVQEGTPDIFIDVDVHDFGSVTVGETRDWTAVVENIGTANLVISEILSSNEVFTTSEPITIAPEGSGTVVITFAPNATGLRQGVITLVSNDPDEEETTINLQGVGTPAPVPDIHIEETFHDFGNVLLGESGSWMMQVLNLGTGDLTVTSVTMVDPDTFSVVFDDPVVIEPETFAEIEVLFTPILNQQVMGELHVISDDPDEEDVAVSLQGRGVSIPNEFSLVTPAQDSLVTELPLTFRWRAATDDDPADEISYELLLGEDAEFAVVDTYAVGLDTFYTMDALADNMTLFWKVLAYDTFTDSNRTSTETWSFNTTLNDPPTPFGLSTPFDSTWVPYFPPLELNFTWDESSDPDEGAELLYSFFGHVTYAELVDTTVSLDSLAENGLTLNLPDSLLFTEWDDTISVEWWVEAISQGDTTQSVDTFHVFFAPSLGVDEWTTMPVEYGIKAVYPNPFNPTATVVVGLPMAAEMRVELFNLLGQRVALLGDGHKQAGHHRYVIDGHRLASGVYFVRATAPGQTVQVRKVVLMR